MADSGSAAVIVVNRRSDVLHEGYAVLWRGFAVQEARAVCSDARTAGPDHFLAWVHEHDLGKHHLVKDDGRYDGVLMDLGIAKRGGTDGAN